MKKKRCAAGKMMRSKPKARDVCGTIAWSDLTAAERGAFTSAFLLGEAHSARLEVLAGSEAGFDSDIAGLLHIHEWFSRHEVKVRSWPKADVPDLAAEVEGVLLTIKERQLEVRMKIEQRLWNCLMSGSWDTIQWLAGYGKSHCPGGLFRLLDLPATVFPEPATRVHKPDDTGVRFCAAMLKAFVELTGCQPELLTYPGRPYPSFEAAIYAAMKGYGREFEVRYFPSCLPTKNQLGRATLEGWHKLAGVKELRDPKSHLSRTMKRLGLSGLPKGSAGPLNDSELSEEGKELREGMGGFQ